MHQRTDLAAGPINGSDRLHIELIQPTDTPPIVVVTWPAKPTVCTPAGYPAAAAAARVIAESATALARWKAGRLQISRDCTRHEPRGIIFRGSVMATFEGCWSL